MIDTHSSLHIIRVGALEATAGDVVPGDQVRHLYDPDSRGTLIGLVGEEATVMWSREPGGPDIRRQFAGNRVAKELNQVAHGFVGQKNGKRLRCHLKRALEARLQAMYIAGEIRNYIVDIIKDPVRTRAQFEARVQTDASSVYTFIRGELK